MELFGSLITIYKEAVSIIKLFKISAIKREIVFYSEDKGSYTYFEGVIDYLTNKSGKDVYYLTSEENDPIFATKNQRLHPFFLKNLLSLFTGLCDSKVLIMTMPDLGTFHVKRSKFDVNHLYMFHNIGSSFPVIRYGALFNYDTIYCAGPHHVEEIRRQEQLYGLREKKLVEFGYFRLEKVYDQYQEFLKNNKGRSGGRTRLLVGPTWGKDSLLNVCGTELIRILLENGYEVVVRPHPMTNIHEPHIMERINKKFKDHPNYIYEKDISLYESLFRSELLITDWSGFCYEYAFGTERPVLFLDVPQKVVNDRYREVGIEPIEIGMRHEVGAVVSPDRLPELPSAIDLLLNGQKEYRERILKARTKYVYNFGDSSRVGAEFILSYCEQKEAM